MALVHVPGNGFTKIRFTCNKFSMQMFHWWVSNSICVRSIFMQDFRIPLLNKFFTFRFFIILILRLSFFTIRIFFDIGLITSHYIQLIDIEFLLVLIIFFLTGYYCAVIVTCCGCLYIIFSLLIGLSANFGLFGCYIILMFWYIIWFGLLKSSFPFPVDFRSLSYFSSYFFLQISS